TASDPIMHLLVLLRMYPVSSHYLNLFSILLHPLPDPSSLPILFVHSPAANVLSQRIVLYVHSMFSVIFLLPFAACHPIVFPYFSPKLPVACPLLQIFPVAFHYRSAGFYAKYPAYYG